MQHPSLCYPCPHCSDLPQLACLSCTACLGLSSFSVHPTIPTMPSAVWTTVGKTRWPTHQQYYLDFFFLFLPCFSVWLPNYYPDSERKLLRQKWKLSPSCFNFTHWRYLIQLIHVGSGGNCTENFHSAVPLKFTCLACLWFSFSSANPQVEMLWQLPREQRLLKMLKHFWNSISLMILQEWIRRQGMLKFSWNENVFI